MGRVGSREHKNGLWRQVETLVPEAHAKAAAYVHYRMTSSDLLDTAPALQPAEARRVRPGGSRYRPDTAELTARGGQPDLGGPEAWAGQEGGAGQAMQAGS